MENLRFSSSQENYDIGQLLGKGGFANVYRARDRFCNMDIALKVIDKNKMINLDLMNRVHNEIQIQSRLCNESIVKLYHTFEDEHFIYLVCELCNGGNLYRYLKLNGPLQETFAVELIRQLLEGLEYIHNSGVIHRDLKLSNILFCNDDYRKILFISDNPKLLD
jgi:polo-like kinase 4